MAPRQKRASSYPAGELHLSADKPHARVTRPEVVDEDLAPNSLISHDRMPRATSDKLLFDVNETAASLSISRTSCYELIAAGVLPHILLGSRIRIPVRALENWIAEQQEAAGGTAAERVEELRRRQNGQR